MHSGSWFRTVCRLLALCVAMVVGGTAQAACGVATTVAADLGSLSPNALKAGAPPFAAVFGGFSCTTVPVAALLTGNYLKATVASGSVLKLSATTTPDTVSYALSATANGSAPLNPGAATFYVNGTVLNVLGLLGPGQVDVPVYVKPQAATTIAPGTYKGSVAIKWEWYFCSLVGALNACIGTLEAGSQTATINFTLEVAAKPAIVSIEAVTTWDPVSATTNPKAIPESRRRTALTVTNGDIVAVDIDTLKLVLPTGAGTILALDGDGTGSGAIVQTVQGTPPSGLTVSYVGPATTTDDVDFSSDGGVSYTYVPVAGNRASQGAVTHVRVSPKGSMAAKSSVSISIPYLVR